MTRNSYTIAIIAVLVSFFAVNTASAQYTQKSEVIHVMAIQKIGPATTYGGETEKTVTNDHKEVWRRAAGINVSIGGIYDFHEMGGFGGNLEVGYEHDYWRMFVQGGYSQYSYKGFDYNGLNTKIGAGLTLFKFRNSTYCSGKEFTGHQLNIDVFFAYDRLNTGDTEETYFVKDYTSGFGGRLEYQRQIAEFVSGDHTVPMYITLGGEIKTNDNYGDKTTNKIHGSAYVKIGFKF